MKFSKEYQPRRVKKNKVKMHISVEPTTKEYFNGHRTAGKILDRYVREEQQ